MPAKTLTSSILSAEDISAIAAARDNHDGFGSSAKIQSACNRAIKDKKGVASEIVGEGCRIALQTAVMANESGGTVGSRFIGITLSLYSAAEVARLGGLDYKAYSDAAYVIALKATELLRQSHKPDAEHDDFTEQHSVLIGIESNCGYD